MRDVIHDFRNGFHALPDLSSSFLYRHVNLIEKQFLGIRESDLFSQDSLVINIIRIKGWDGTDVNLSISICWHLLLLLLDVVWALPVWCLPTLLVQVRVIIFIMGT
jgi:hypothetical protein